MGIIKNQFFNKPIKIKGLVTTKKSCTIPGQDFTPQEILRNFTQGRHTPEHMFTDVPVDSFNKLNIQDKLDYLKNLSQTNAEQKTQVQLKLKKIAADYKHQQQELQKQKLKNELRDEIKNANDDKTK